MNASDAKYKVYLHQDVFILNRDFISDILAIFRRDETIGMIGVVGGVDLPPDGIYYLAWNVGKVKADNAEGCLEAVCNQAHPYMEVEAIDGMIMISQHDVPWREDLFTDWDFYDASQSFEFRRRGYRVVVPWQNESWCMHDCGLSKLVNYDKNRTIFAREYLGEASDGASDIEVVYKTDLMTMMEEMLECLISLINAGLREQACQMLENVPCANLLLTDLRIMKNIFDIHALELADVGRDYGLFMESHDNWQGLRSYYMELKYYLRRLEQGLPAGAQAAEGAFDLPALYRGKKIGKAAIYVLAELCLFDGEAIVKKGGICS